MTDPTADGGGSGDSSGDGTGDTTVTAAESPVAATFPEDLPRRGNDDALGLMVWDYHREAYDGTAISRSWRGGAHDARPSMYFAGDGVADGTAAALDAVTATVDRLGDRPVADVGCGPGRHARDLADRGVPVVGVDPSPLALRTARARGSTPALQGDVTRLPLAEDALAAVFMCGTQLGVTGTVDGLRAALGGFDRAVAPGGRVVADLADPTAHASLLAAADIRGTPTDDIVRVDEARGTGLRRLRTEYDGAVGPWVDLLLLTPDAAARSVEPTPWRLADTLGDETEGSRYYLVLER